MRPLAEADILTGLLRDFRQAGGDFAVASDIALRIAQQRFCDAAAQRGKRLAAAVKSVLQLISINAPDFASPETAPITWPCVAERLLKRRFHAALAEDFQRQV